MTTSLTYINAALTRVGEAPLTSLDDGTAAAVVAAQNYEPLVLSELSAYPWKWATTTRHLNLVEGTPHPPWRYAYQLPTDLEHLRTVEVCGKPIPYERQFGKVLCQYGGDSLVVGKFLWRVPEAYWPAWWSEPMTLRLEALFLRSLREEHAKAEAWDRNAARAFLAARLIDSQSQPPADPYRSGLLEARRA